MFSEKFGHRPGNMAKDLTGLAALSDDHYKVKTLTLDASTTHAIFVIRLKGPRLSSHNPLDGLRVQPLNYVHN